MDLGGKTSGGGFFFHVLLSLKVDVVDEYKQTKQVLTSKRYTNAKKHSPIAMILASCPIIAVIEQKLLGKSKVNECRN